MLLTSDTTALKSSSAIAETIACPFKTPYDTAMHAFLEKIKQIQSNEKTPNVLVVDIDNTVLRYPHELILPSAWKRRFAKTKAEDTALNRETIICFGTFRYYYGGIKDANFGEISEGAFWRKEIATLMSAYKEYIDPNHIIATGGLGESMINLAEPSEDPLVLPQPGCKGAFILEKLINAGVSRSNITMFDDNENVIEIARTLNCQAVQIPITDDALVLQATISGRNLFSASSFFSPKETTDTERLKKLGFANTMQRTGPRTPIVEDGIVDRAKLAEKQAAMRAQSPQFTAS